MAAAIEDRFPDAEVELVPSSGGVFEVVADGDLVFSKKRTGRHATHDEVLAAIA